MRYINGLGQFVRDVIGGGIPGATQGGRLEPWIYDNVVSLGILATVPGNGWMNLEYERALELRRSIAARLGMVGGLTTFGASYRFWLSRGASLTQWFVGPAADYAIYNGGSGFRGGVEAGHQIIFDNHVALTPRAGVYFNTGGLQLGIGLCVGYAWGN